MYEEMIVEGVQMVQQTTHLSRLTIKEGGRLTAPEGKFVQLTVNGAGKQQKPGVYQGDVILSVAKSYHMPPHGLMQVMGRSEEFRNAIVVENGAVAREKCVPAVIQGGSVTDQAAQDLYIASDEESFNGILVTGDSEYTINNVKMDLDGFGANDFMGVGAGITAVDNAHVTINDSEIKLSGVTRCAVHVGGDSVVTVNNCKLVNHSPDAPEWIGDFSWGVGFVGCNRLVQLCDNGTAYYNNCDLDTNGWGVFSIDGCDDSVKYYMKDCRVNLSGPNSHGYGAFCIGDRNVVRMDHCKMRVNGYALIVRGMIGAARAEIVNGCEISGNRFGVFCVGDKATPVTISDSSILTDKATFVVKGSSTVFHVDNAKLKPRNGVLLQLMDNDEAGMFIKTVKLPVGRVDVPVEGRDLSVIHPEEDVTMNFANMDLKGNFFNSTTNLHMENEAVPGRSGKVTFGGMFDPPEGSDGLSFLDAEPPEGVEPHEKKDYDAGLRGPKNLALNLVNVRLEGVVSSAVAAYREGLTQIEEDQRLELSNITQTAAPTVNNGVIVDLDKDSSWLVTGTCYITGLKLADTAILKGYGGKKLTMTVDGAETAIQAGSYRGTIVLSLDEA